MDIHDLQTPQLEDEGIIRDYVKEHYENGETSISASHGLTSSEYGQWVERINRNALTGDKDFGKSFVTML